MTRLKNCPFCGGEAKLENNGIFARVICLKCRIWQDDYDTECADEAINAWNRRADDWQPIDTAPKDGTVFEVWDKETKRSWRAYYYSSDLGSTWVVSIGNNFDDLPERFTHWQPLPTPPQETDNG